MLTIEIPRREPLQLRYLVLDVNGTIAEDGHLIPGVPERLRRLAEVLDVVMVTADTHGRQAAIEHELGLVGRRLGQHPPEDEQKAALVAELGAAGTVAIGNGTNDALMLDAAAIGIAVVNAEGASTAAVRAADVVCRSAGDALDLLLIPRRLVATLRR